MDTEKAEKKQSASLFSNTIQVAAVFYLVPLIAILVAIDVFEVWPGHDLPFNKNVSALIDWSQLALAYSFLGALMFVPLLLLAGVRKPRLPLTISLVVAYLCAPVVAWYLRWYDDFGIGV